MGAMTRRTADRALMREWNTKLVLSLIRSRSVTSQAEILRESGLSAATVAHITRELRRQGFVKTAGRGVSEGGRRPVMLRFNPEARYVVGAGLFASETALAVVDLAGRIRGTASFATRPERGCARVFEEFAACVRRLLDERSIPVRAVEGVCVGFAGMVSSEEGVLLLSTHLGWRRVPAREMLADATGLKTYVDTEGSAMALGEYWYGAGRGVREMIVAEVDDGIGVVSVRDGAVRRGIHSMDGEVGHSIMVEGGRRCRCGRKGCLEAFASGPGMIEGYAERGGDGRVARLPRREAVRRVLESAATGDRRARAAVGEGGRLLGVALAHIANYADPERIVIVGYVPEEDARGVYLEAVRESFERNVFGLEQRRVDIVKGALGAEGVLIGAATMAYRSIFTLPGLS